MRKKKYVAQIIEIIVLKLSKKYFGLEFICYLQECFYFNTTVPYMLLEF